MDHSRLKREVAITIKNLRQLKLNSTFDDIEEVKHFGINCREQLEQLNNLAKYIPESDELELKSLMIKDIDDIHTNYSILSNVRAKFPEIESRLELPSSRSDGIIDTDLIEELTNISSREFNIEVLVKLCEEANFNCSHDNIISTASIMRTILNYVPPVFNAPNLKALIAKSERNFADILRHLELGLRPIANRHLHGRINRKEGYPTKNQIEPFKGSFEVLLQQIIIQLKSFT